ncbi:MAG TPA: hypothetical protein VFA66_02420 [Gaiellaceae bacterium]|nr:hypothetical protein [Gaiellaceae bacterium]
MTQLRDLERTRILLATLRDVLDSCHPTPTQTRGHEHTPRQLAPEYHQGSYRRPEQALRAHRDLRPVLYWHVAEYHLRSHRRVVRVPQLVFDRRSNRLVPRRDRDGDVIYLPGRIEVVRHPRVPTTTGTTGRRLRRAMALRPAFEQGGIWLPGEITEIYAT